MYKNGERMMAWISRVNEIKAIENADAIEAYRVGGWWVVDKKASYKVGELVVYISIDSWVPTELAPFLSKGKEPREFEGVRGERLRTVKLRGTTSQGLLLPLSILPDSLKQHPSFWDEVDGFDVTDILGIKKWEMPIPTQLAGLMKGPLPTQIPKTDQERVQNLVEEIKAGGTFEVTEKLEGSSMTVYRIQGEFGVCSRNIELIEDANNSFWKVALRDKINEKMCEVDPYWDWAIQGELIGPGIQGNIYGLKELEFRVFDVYNIQTGEYITPHGRRTLIENMGLNHVPMIDDNFVLVENVDGILEMAEGTSQLAPVEREGIVFKEVNGGFSFKSVSNRYLIGEK